MYRMYIMTPEGAKPFGGYFKQELYGEQESLMKDGMLAWVILNNKKDE